MIQKTNDSPIKDLHKIKLVLLTIIVGLSSCHEECLCPVIDTIPFIEVRLTTNYTSDLDGYFPEIYPSDPPINYGYSYNTNNVEYCGHVDFKLSDSTAMVIGTGDILYSFSERQYYIDVGGPSENLWNYITIRGVSEDGVLYYTFASYLGNFFETTGEGESGTLPLGGVIDYHVAVKDTIALTEEDMERMFGQAIIFDEEGNYFYLDYYTQDFLPLPDSTVITTTYRFYINNVALVSKDDFVDNGQCYAL